MRGSRLAIALAGLVVTVAAAGVAVRAAPARNAGVTLSLVAYSTPRDAYSTLIPAFQKTPDGDGVSFTQSYGASGDQARAIIAGLKADVVELSLAPDMDQLAQAGIVDPKWKKQSYKGMVTDSVVVFVVRNGNPKHIKSWNDLIRPGVQVVTPNPFQSGGARWNIMAAYGAWRKQGKTDRQAQANLLKLFKNVVAQDKSARDSVNTFLAGRGDVLLSYENEALGGEKKGQNLPFIVPKSTILIENPIAVTKTSANKDKANQFLRFLRTPAAQQVFADWGYRPVVPSVLAKNRKKFPVRPGQFTIDQLGLGGWDKVQKRFFDPKSSIMSRIESRVGGVTG
ncbi:MAG: sulfate ABC transporter substrate-binding protein [Actinobacteria bacterium]|nr:MAG: sulfate ABC transporter substrate-binding protein [Actinomycetota bacterium]